MERPGVQPQINISSELLLNVKCQKCDGIYFQTVVELKIIPKLLDPNMVDDMIKPMIGYQCIDCGEILLIV